MLSLDWFQAGLGKLSSHLIDEILVLFDFNKLTKSRFYSASQMASYGSFSYNPKPGCKNDFATIQLTGKFFLLDDWQDRINFFLNLCVENSVSINPQRIDVRYDWKDSGLFAANNIQFESFRLPGGYYQDIRRVCTGFWAGKGDIRYRLYDKSKEQKLIGDWWRYEVQVRGDVLKECFSFLDTSQYIEWGSFSLPVAQYLSSRKKIMIFPEFIQEDCRKIIDSEQLPRVHQEKPTIQKKYSFFCKQLRERVFQLDKACTRINKNYILNTGLFEPGELPDDLNRWLAE